MTTETPSISPSYPPTIWARISQRTARVRRFYFRNQKLILTSSLILCLGLAVFFSQSQDRAYFNKDVGYRIVIPAGWSSVETNKKATVTLTKRKKLFSTLPDNMIRIEAVLGNPYGTTSLDYILNGMLPSAQYDFMQVQHKNLTLRQDPSLRSINGREWGVVQLLVDSQDLYLIYATKAGEYTLVLILASPTGLEQEAVEKTFYKVIRSVVIDPPQRRNYFLEKETDRKLFLY